MARREWNTAHRARPVHPTVIPNCARTEAGGCRQFRTALSSYRTLHASHGAGVYSHPCNDSHNPPHPAAAAKAPLPGQRYGFSPLLLPRNGAAEGGPKPCWTSRSVIAVHGAPAGTLPRRPADHGCEGFGRGRLPGGRRRPLCGAAPAAGVGGTGPRPPFRRRALGAAASAILRRTHACPHPCGSGTAP
jgi:hypothetical protein